MDKPSVTRDRPRVYHIMLRGHRQVAAASTLVRNGPRIALQLDPEIVGSHDVFIDIDPRKLRPLDEEGGLFGYPELVDRRSPELRRRCEPRAPRSAGRRAEDRRLSSGPAGPASL